MPFLKREQIGRKLRKPHEGAYKNQLRQALGNPNLTAEQKQQIKDQLREVGGPKKYRADSPPRLGAISLVDPLPHRKILEKLKRVDLIELARRLDVPTNGTKAQIVDRLLATKRR